MIAQDMTLPYNGVGVKCAFEFVLMYEVVATDIVFSVAYMF